MWQPIYAFWVLYDAQKAILHFIDFDMFANPAVMLQNNARLVTALVESWRPETNTLFMRHREMTVILEDVGFILRLPTTGRLIVGDDIYSRRRYFARNWCEPLTNQQVNEAFTRIGVKYTWLYETHVRVDPGPDLMKIAIHTQAYLFFIVGSILFPTLVGMLCIEDTSDTCTYL